MLAVSNSWIKTRDNFYLLSSVCINNTTASNGRWWLNVYRGWGNVRFYTWARAPACQVLLHFWSRAELPELQYNGYDSGWHPFKVFFFDSWCRTRECDHRHIGGWGWSDYTNSGIRCELRQTIRDKCWIFVRHLASTGWSFSDYVKNIDRPLCNMGMTSRAVYKLLLHPSG